MAFSILICTIGIPIILGIMGYRDSKYKAPGSWIPEHNEFMERSFRNYPPRMRRNYILDKSRPIWWIYHWTVYRLDIQYELLGGFIVNPDKSIEVVVDDEYRMWRV